MTPEPRRIPSRLRDCAALILVYCTCASAIAFAQEKTPLEADAQREAALRLLAPSLRLNFKIDYSPINATWAHSAKGTVKADGTAEASIVKSEKGRKITELREGRLDDAQRLELLNRVLDGLDRFTVDRTRPESDEADVRMKVSLGSSTITTRGCFDRFAVGPVRFVVSALPKRNPQETIDRPSPEVKPEADLGGVQDQVALRHNRRRLIRGELSEWKGALQIMASKKRVLQVSLSERGHLFIRGDDEAFPQLSNVGKTLTNEDRDRLLDLFARTLEGFALAKSRGSSDEPKESLRRCKVSLEAPCYEFTIEEDDLDWNQRLSADLQKLIDAVSELAGRAS